MISSVRCGDLEPGCPVIRVCFYDGGITADYDAVFGVALLSRFGEVERPGEDGLLIEDHDLIVGNGRRRVDHDRDPGIFEEGRAGVLLSGLAFVHNHPDVDLALEGVENRLGDRFRGEGVCLNQERLSGVVDGVHQEVLATGSVRYEAQ